MTHIPDGAEERELARHEAVAINISGWQTAVVPGLLQTTRYTEAILTRLPGGQELSAQQLLLRTKLRSGRQTAVFSRQPPVICQFFLHEAVLRHLAEHQDRELAREQLAKLLYSVRQLTTIRIVSFKVGICPAASEGAIHLVHGIASPSRLMREQTFGPTTMVSSVEDEAAVRAASEAIQAFGDLALTQVQSLALIRSVLDRV